MAHKTVRVDQSTYDKAAAAAAVNQRSVSGQLAHWADIGRVIEQSPTFDAERVEMALRAEIAYDELTPEENDVYLSKFFKEMRTPSNDVDDYFAKLEAEAKAVGYTGE